MYTIYIVRPKEVRPKEVRPNSYEAKYGGS